MLDAPCFHEPACENLDPVVQVSWQGDKEHDCHREPEFEVGGINKNLVIEPTHHSNSGAYYCATADDIAQLIVKNQGDLSVLTMFSVLMMTNSE